MADVPYPPAPWHLFGRAILVPALVRPPLAARGPRLLRAPGRRSLGGLLLADYDPRSTLAYHELLGVGGLVWSGTTPAAWITHACVDDGTSVAGGRGIWGISKHHGDFAWARTAAGERITVSLAGREMVAVRTGHRPGAVSVPVVAPFAGADGGRPAWASGWLRGAPVTVDVHVAPDSALAELAPRFAAVAVAGDVALRISAPRAARRG
ncbi:MAG: hypothetical protein AVDCRST_MAG38-1534 [uncultured Solirubrobacteraceae bacterium]|uniref:Acetoacetate decarboxylase n=1 Tax=uncultured Solirubrobacteraceae bacterium TaxID=1162706 RepID=A0A6J4RLC8_9ACTN|nr:MAG: hypothetical protein AVDCRST_MAG38-1534 [uncultured Solirubrobacteraceae bacterium]